VLAAQCKCAKTNSDQLQNWHFIFVAW